MMDPVSKEHLVRRLTDAISCPDGLLARRIARTVVSLVQDRTLEQARFLEHALLDLAATPEMQR